MIITKKYNTVTEGEFLDVQVQTILNLSSQIQMIN